MVTVDTANPLLSLETVGRAMNVIIASIPRDPFRGARTSLARALPDRCGAVQ